MSAPKKITAWSYSRLTTYEECPFKARCKFVDKLPEPGSKAMDRGSEVHAQAQQFVEGKLPRVPAELKPIAGYLASFKKSRAVCEQELAFDSQWKPVDWFAPNAWLRSKLDVVNYGKIGRDVVAHVTDYKTGKVRPANEDQIELYCVSVLSADEMIYGASARLLYVDAGIVLPEKTRLMQRDQLPELQKKWTARAKPMLTDTRFAPRAGPYCGWCHYRKSNGGPCKF